MSSPESPNTPEHSETSGGDTVQDMRKRFRFRFSLKSLGLATMLAAGVTWFVSSPFHEAERNNAVKKRVEKNGGWARTDTKTVRDGIRYVLKPVDIVTAVDLSQEWITDEDLKNLALTHATEIQDLSLFETQITDASIPTIIAMKNIESLSIADTAITDEGLKRFLHMPQLRSLDAFSMRRITDEGMKHLATHPGLSHLAIGGPNITDEGLMHLAKSKNLSTLFIAQCRATPEGIQRLHQALPSCRISYLPDMRWKDN